MLSSQGNSSGPIAHALTLLVLPLAVPMLVNSSLSALAEPVELLWTINAKMRMKRWMFPALAAGAVLSIVAFLVVLATGLNGRLPVGLECLAFAVPIGALSVFGLAGIRRYLAMVRGAAVF